MPMISHLPTDSELAIETRALTKRFGSSPALRDLSLSVERGGVHAVVGRNGAGKSTLFSVLLGFLHPDAGSSRVLGVESTQLTPELRGRIGLVTEDHALPGWMSVAGLLAMQRAFHPTWSQALCDEVLGLFNIPGTRRVATLSRGERAGLALALAVAPRPELLILDEPTLGLDAVAHQAFIEALLVSEGGEDGSGDDFAESRRTVLFCSHRMDEIERVTDSVILLENGDLLLAASPEEIGRRVLGWTAELPKPLDAKALDAKPPDMDLPGVLQARVIDGLYHLSVLDQGEGFADELRALGAGNVSCRALGFGPAVRAILDRRFESSFETDKLSA